MEDNVGRQYVLCTIDKYVENAVPEELHKTFAVDLVQDQISASNPYAAPVVAALAGHAGVFHTNPEVVYVPDDPRFGIYRSDVAGKLFLFEERPDDDRPWIAARKWLLPKIQGFTEYTENMEGQSFNARYFDRSFLIKSNWDEWLRQIDSLRVLLTPEKIDSAMYVFPNEVVPLFGSETGLKENDMEAHAYAGAYFKYELNTLTGMERKTEEEFTGSNTFPTRGMHLNTRVGYFAGLNEETNNFLKLSGVWVTYLSVLQSATQGS